MAIDISKYENLMAMIEQYNLINPLYTSREQFLVSTMMNSGSLLYDPKTDILLLNSKKNKNGSNLYQNFVDRYYFKGINLDILTGNSREAMFPLISAEMSPDGKSRRLEFKYYYTLLNMLEDRERFKQMPNNELELCDYVKKYLIETRNKYNDVLKNLKSSLYYHEIENKFKSVNMEVNQRTLTLNRDLYNNLINVVRNIRINIAEGVIVPEDRLIECFDKEKFYLIFCKCIMENVLYFEKKDGTIHTSFAEAYQYLDLIKQAGLENEYNINIVYHDGKRIRNYSVNDLRREVEGVLKRHKDTIKTLNINSEQASKLGIIRNADNLDKLVKITSNQDADIISTDWDILAPGEKEEQVIKKRTNKNSGQTLSNKTVDDSEILLRKMVFESTGYKTKILGKDKFAGYIGYMYENGLVVFEKFYEDYLCTIPAKSNATYIMNYKNFTNFSKMDKQEIMRFIKDTDNPDIDRLYHSKNWAKRLPRVIAGVDYNEEAVMLINSLLENQKDNKLKK
ncbi:MAG: hypothetical protein ACI4WW_04390 [Candidatus Coprovivens sp.]